MNKRKSLQQFLLQGLFSFIQTHLKGGENMRPTRKQIIFQNLVLVAHGLITEEHAKACIREELEYWKFKVAPSNNDKVEKNAKE